MIKQHYGESVMRFTTDFDVTRASILETFLDELKESPQYGWSGFTGTVLPREPASLRCVPTAYLMRSYDTKLSYNGSPWCTAPLEDGRNKIGDADA